eukprot:357993-Chlamydomonas_euryale.AAC.1
MARVKRIQSDGGVQRSDSILFAGCSHAGLLAAAPLASWLQPRWPPGCNHAGALAGKLSTRSRPVLAPLSSSGYRTDQVAARATTCTTLESATDVTERHGASHQCHAKCVCSPLPR